MEHDFCGSKYQSLLNQAKESIFELEQLYQRETNGDFWLAREARFKLTEAENRIRHLFKVDELPIKPKATE